MRKLFIFFSGLYAVSVILTSMSALAAEPVASPTETKKIAIPSKEFWDYLEEYGDDKGEVLDPLEYDQMLSLKESDEFGDLDKPDVKKIDMKVEQKSSSRTSSVAMKGEPQ